MTPEQLLREVERLGHPARVSGGEVQVRVCTACGNPRWNQELSAAKAVWHCWACGASGTVAGLLRALGGEPPDDLRVRLDDARDPVWARTRPVDLPPTVPLHQVRSAEAWAARRGIRAGEAAALGIAACVDRGPYALRLVVPLREYWEGRPVGFTARTWVGARPKYLHDVDCPASLPGWRAASPVHVIVEGALDALAVRSAGHGAAALLGTGRGAAALAWAARVPPGERVVVMLDADAAGEGEALAAVLSQVAEVAVATLPAGSDPGSVGREVVRAAVDAAAGIAHVTEVEPLHEART